jgi:regulator of sirC expression with transglutaminase-like and TPR domain
MIDLNMSSFKREVRQAEPDLARAALLYAREMAYPNLVPSNYIAQLDSWADTVQRRLNRTDTILTRVGHLADFMFGELHFKGNTVDYIDPRNSYLNDVMDRRLGLPITLSVVFMEIGQRLGLPVEGVGLPGHFIVGVQAEAGRYFFDPFNGGSEVTEDDAARLVHDSIGHTGVLGEDWLDASPPRAILMRMLNNLRNTYIEQKAWAEAIAAVEHLSQLQPDLPDHLRDLGLLHYRNQSPRRAFSLLEEYLTQTPDAQDADDIRARVAVMLDQYTKLN